MRFPDFANANGRGKSDWAGYEPDLGACGHCRLFAPCAALLLETVSTAFQGLSTNENESIRGKYFNTIVDELRKQNQGTALDQIIGWLKTLHGYLSAPAGGGIRHGMHLKEGVATSEGEAKLYCNLITSYIPFLLSEYQRLTAAMSRQE